MRTDCSHTSAGSKLLDLRYYGDNSTFVPIASMRKTRTFYPSALIRYEDWHPGDAYMILQNDSTVADNYDGNFVSHRPGVLVPACACASVVVVVG